jgi:hypothetical protein
MLDSEGLLGGLFLKATIEILVWVYISFGG